MISLPLSMSAWQQQRETISELGVKGLYVVWLLTIASSLHFSRLTWDAMPLPLTPKAIAVAAILICAMPAVVTFCGWRAFGAANS